jgi:hypothetical protein
VLEIGSTSTIPKLATILLVGSPITFHGKCLATFSAQERLDSMLSLVMSLKGSKISERLCSWMINVVYASCCTAVAREPKHCCWLRTS